MPTLIVGLGGTGTRIVQKIRMHWKNQIPKYVGLAVIDALDQYPFQGAAEGIAFTLVEPPCNIIRTFGEFSDVIEEWWPKDVAPQAHIDFTNGCGAIRANGKLFALRYAGTIERTIQKAIQHLVAKSFSSTGSGKLNFQIILIGSLGNGTGGGIFMDVAAMIKHTLSATAQTQCYGVFIPGSVTKHGDPGTVGTRVSASGYASLIELQHEFDREKTSDSRPLEPYSHKGWDGQFIKTYEAGRLKPNPEKELPIDRVFLIDGTDRRGRVSDYPTLLNIAAESIIMLTEGRDQDNQMLNGLSHTLPGNKFGSFGAARIAVPAEQLLEYATLKQSLNTLDTAVSGQLIDEWKILLSDSTPDESKVLSPKDATVESSVNFLMDNITRMKETGKPPLDPKKVNQLFDRFEEGDRILLNNFNDILSGLESARKTEEIVQKASLIRYFVNENIKNLRSERRQVLLEGSESLWLKVPTEPQKPIDAGVKWHLDQRIMEFINAGAFGLLLLWLKEFDKQIDINHDSVLKNEKANWLSVTSHKDIDLAAPFEDIVEKSNSIFAWFKKTELIEDVEIFHQNAKDYFLYLLWESKVSAVEDFYEVVKNYIGKIKRGVESVVSRLTEIQLKKPIEDRLNEIVQNLDVNVKQKIGSEGLQAVLFVGGDKAARDRIIKYLKKAQDTSPQSALKLMGNENKTIFLNALDSDIRQDFQIAAEEKIAHNVSMAELRDNYRNTLTQKLGHMIEPALRGFCEIDSVLVLEARELLENYYEQFYENRNSISDVEKYNALRALQEAATPDFAQLIQNLDDWKTSKANAIDKSIQYVIAGRLSQVVDFATAQWTITALERETPLIHSDILFTYPMTAHGISQAIQLYNSKFGSGKKIASIPVKFHNQRQLDIIKVELGADLEMLPMEDEKVNYRHCMLNDKGFCPHTTQYYYEVGKKFFEKTGELTPEGPVLLALAELYGLIRSDVGGNYKIDRDILARDQDGRTVHPAYVKETPVGPRGLSAFSNFLDSDAQEAKTLQRMLKIQLYELIRDDVYGNPGETMPLGWPGLCEKLYKYSAQVRKNSGNDPYESHREIKVRQCHDIENLAAELNKMQGRAVPNIFK